MPIPRLDRARDSFRALGFDALLVTHPPNIRYLTGLAASTAAALVRGRECVLVVDSRYLTAARVATAGQAGVRVELAKSSLDEAIAKTLVGCGDPRVAVEAEHLSLAQFNRLMTRVADSSSRPELVATDRIVERLRAIKDDVEIATLREAARRLSAVAQAVAPRISAGQSEITIAAMVDAAVREAGFERAAFETIVGSGPNSALPHARPTTRQLMKGDPVVLDFGGVYDGYCVDLTRTLHIGPMSAQFRRLFEAVQEARMAAIAMIRPGALPADIDGAAREALARHGLAEAFGHGTGHGLGLEVHEEPRISRLAPSGEPVAAGMVFTVEPGVYVPGVGGVRIEDDVLVVEGGCEVLTDLPIDL